MEHQVKEIHSKLQSNLTSTEHSNIKEQVSKNEELAIQQLRRKKTLKYRQLKYGEQIPEMQTRNSSVKFSQPNQEKNFLYLIKILIFVLGLTNIINKTSTKIFLSFTVILNLRHVLDQLKVIQMNLDLKAEAIGYQINYAAVLKLSYELSIMI